MTENALAQYMWAHTLIGRDSCCLLVVSLQTVKSNKQKNKKHICNIITVEDLKSTFSFLFLL